MPTASTWPQYGPAKIGAGCNIQIPAARIAAAFPAYRRTSGTSSSTMPMSAGMLIAFTAKRSASPCMIVPSSQRT